MKPFDDLIVFARGLPAAELVLFGSRAAGVAHRGSDWDVLLVCDRAPVSVPMTVDLVVVSASRLHSRRWLGSELAGHVGAHGRWLVGDPSWTGKVFRSRRALERKATRIARRVVNLQRNWADLEPAYRATFLKVLRRDLQRYECLEEGRPVPPTRILDLEWLRGPNGSGSLFGEGIDGQWSSVIAMFSRYPSLARNVSGGVLRAYERLCSTDDPQSLPGRTQSVPVPKIPPGSRRGMHGLRSMWLSEQD